MNTYSRDWLLPWAPGFDILVLIMNTKVCPVGMRWRAEGDCSTELPWFRKMVLSGWLNSIYYLTSNTQVWQGASWHLTVVHIKKLNWKWQSTADHEKTRSKTGSYLVIFTEFWHEAWCQRTYCQNQIPLKSRRSCIWRCVHQTTVNWFLKKW